MRTTILFQLSVCEPLDASCSHNTHAFRCRCFFFFLHSLSPGLLVFSFNSKSSMIYRSRTWPTFVRNPFFTAFRTNSEGRVFFFVSITVKCSFCFCSHPFLLHDHHTHVFDRFTFLLSRFQVCVGVRGNFFSGCFFPSKSPKSLIFSYVIRKQDKCSK